MAKKYAVFSDAGVLKSLLIHGVHDIPKRAIEINEEQWQQVNAFVDSIWTWTPKDGLQKSDREVNHSQRISAARFRYETAGIRFGDIAIDTGRDGQILITGAALSAVVDPTYRCTWKALNGPVELNAQQLIDIASAVRTHVQACFDRESQLLEALAEGNYAEDMLTQGWPT